MVVILAKCTVKSNKIEEFVRYASELVNESSKEKGCISYELCQDLKEKTKFVFVEKWQDNAAIVIHNNSEHFTAIVPKLGELQECASEVSIYEII